MCGNLVRYLALRHGFHFFSTIFSELVLCGLVCVAHFTRFFWCRSSRILNEWAQVIDGFMTSVCRELVKSDIPAETNKYTDAQTRVSDGYVKKACVSTIQWTCDNAVGFWQVSCSRCVLSGVKEGSTHAPLHRCSACLYRYSVYITPEANRLKLWFGKLPQNCWNVRKQSCVCVAEHACVTTHCAGSRPL